MVQLKKGILRAVVFNGKTIQKHTASKITGASSMFLQKYYQKYF